MNMKVFTLRPMNATAITSSLHRPSPRLPCLIIAYLALRSTQDASDVMADLSCTHKNVPDPLWAVASAALQSIRKSMPFFPK